jgi:hypothetical protein
MTTLPLNPTNIHFAINTSDLHAADRRWAAELLARLTTNPLQARAHVTDAARDLLHELGDESWAETRGKLAEAVDMFHVMAGR